MWMAQNNAVPEACDCAKKWVTIGLSQAMGLRHRTAGMATAAQGSSGVSSIVHKPSSVTAFTLSPSSRVRLASRVRLGSWVLSPRVYTQPQLAEQTRLTCQTRQLPTILQITRHQFQWQCRGIQRTCPFFFFITRGGARVFAWGGGGGKMSRYCCASPKMLRQPWKSRSAAGGGGGGSTTDTFFFPT